MRSLCAQLKTVAVHSRGVDTLVNEGILARNIPPSGDGCDSLTGVGFGGVCLQNKVAVDGNRGVDIQQQQHQQHQDYSRNEKRVCLQNNVAVDGNRGVDIQQQQYEQQQGSSRKEKRLCLQNKVTVDGNSGVDIQQQQHQQQQGSCRNEKVCVCKIK